MPRPAPRECPARRDSVIADLAPFPAIAAAWRRSRATLQEMAKRLSAADLDVGVLAVAASGSLGRMEQLPSSDCDLIVLLDDDAAGDPDRAARVCQSVWRTLDPLGLPTSNPRGIYAAPSCPRELLDPVSRGRVDEPVGTFGRRIQLLIDAQPVFGDARFFNLQSGILARYLHDDTEPDRAAASPAIHVRYLLDDLIRYHRSLHVYYRWDARDRPAKWRLRNIKLRHNRLINFAGLLFLLGETASGRLDLPLLEQSLRLTPLERIAAVATAADAPHLSRILCCYDRFLALLADSSTLERLHESSSAEPVGSAAAEQARNADFDRLMRNAAELTSELFRLTQARQQHWGDEFAASLIF